jgi:hypothetical protein
MNIQTKELIFLEDFSSSNFYLEGRGSTFHSNVGTNLANCTLQTLGDGIRILKTAENPC